MKVLTENDLEMVSGGWDMRAATGTMWTGLILGAATGNAGAALGGAVGGFVLGGITGFNALEVGK